MTIEAMLPTRYIQAAFSFLVIGVAYLGYARVVVPEIEATLTPTPVAAEQAISNYESPMGQYLDLVRPHFPAGAWERGDNVMVIRHGEFVLLLRDHEIREDGHIEIRPCTIVRMAEKPGDRNWVMQASDRAILQTDKKEKREAGEKTSGFGKIISGYLPGHVVISGSASAPGKNDSVVIETRGIQFTKDAIWTPQDISFRFGKNHGSGRDLTIRLKQHVGEGVQRLPSPSSGPFRQVELVHLDKAVVYLPQRKTLAGQAANAASSGLDEEVPVRLKCDGPVLLDFEAGLARMTRNVLIQREMQGRPADKLTCDALNVEFDHLPEVLTGSTHGLGGSLPQINLKRVVAEGRPAQLSTITEGSIGSNSREARWHTVEAARVVYEYTGPGQLGQIFADGVGRYLTGTSSQKLQLEFGWQRRMEIIPQGSSLQLALVGSASCSIQQLGNIYSDTLWLQMVSDPSLRPLRPGSTGNGLNGLRGMQPERIVADKNVRVESERLDAFTNRLDVHFHEGKIIPQNGKAKGLVLGSPSDRYDNPARESEPTSRYQVRGDRLEINVARSGKDHQLENIVMNGHVTCNELHSDPSRTSMEFTGDYFELSDLVGSVKSGGTAQIRGAPASIRAPRINLFGNTINLSRDQNRFWMDGQGSATVQLPEDIAQRYRSRQPVADIRWEGGMEFDGRTIQCREGVNVVGPAQRIFADAVTATLSEKIDFSDQSFDTSRIELERLVAVGKVNVENRELDDSGWASVDRCQVKRLTVNHSEETVIGEGPGWIETTRRTEAKSPLAPGKNNGGVRGLMFMRVKFELGFDGSLAKRQMSFKDRIEAIYGPVDNWNQRLEFGPAAQLVPESAVLRCQQLVAYQLPQGGGKDQFEMIAGGSATISGKAGTGQTFAARSSRISYQQSKDLLMLTGDNRTEAELWYQNKVGGESSKASARQFLYWPKTNRIKVEGSNMLDFHVGGAQ